MITFMNYAGTLGVATQDVTQADVRSALSGWLTGAAGYDAWDAEAAVERARIERAWWSDNPEVHFGQQGVEGCVGIVVVTRLGHMADQLLATAWAAGDGQGAIEA